MRLTPHLSIFLLLMIPTPAFAYMGPGLGMGFLMTSLGVVLSILIGLFAILWYPVKRLFRRIIRRSDRK